MIHAEFRMTCSDCCKREVAARGETVDELRELAFEAGWISEVVNNGSVWDFCPECKASRPSKCAKNQ